MTVRANNAVHWLLPTNQIISTKSIIWQIFHMADFARVFRLMGKGQRSAPDARDWACADDCGRYTS